MNNDAKREKRNGGQERTTYFGMGFSKIWRGKIYNIIRKLRDSNGIKWLRTRMSYHRSPNLGELLQGDLIVKSDATWHLKLFSIENATVSQLPD